MTSLPHRMAALCLALAIALVPWASADRVCGSMATGGGLGSPSSVPSCCVEEVAPEPELESCCCAPTEPVLPESSLERPGCDCELAPRAPSTPVDTPRAASLEDLRARCAAAQALPAETGGRAEPSLPGEVGRSGPRAGAGTPPAVPPTVVPGAGGGPRRLHLIELARL